MNEEMIKKLSCMYALLSEIYSEVAKMENMKITNWECIRNKEEIIWDGRCFTEIQSNLIEIAQALRTIF